MADPFKAVVLTLFPEMFPGVLGASLAQKAKDQAIWTLETVNIRDFATDKHATVDDTPYGGGAGMVMRPDVVDAAIEAAWPGSGPLIYLTPRGRVLDQKRMREIAAEPGVTLICGRYEGIDQRVLEARDVEEVSLGDFILSGGEVAAMTLLDAVIRLLPGVVGCETSLTEESFETGLLEYPLYTRPPVWQGREIPEILTSGHHAKVAEWRREQAEAVTKARRPDLWAAYQAELAEKGGNRGD